MRKQVMRRLSLLLALLLNLLQYSQASNSLGTSIKLTALKCKAGPPQLVDVEVCRLDRLGNETKLFVLTRIYDRPIKSIRLRFRSFRKEPTGYEPFIIDFNMDWCDFLSKRNNLVMNRIFGILEHYSNLNTKCPHDRDYSYVNMSLSKNGGFVLPFKFPTGDYRLDMVVDANEAIQMFYNAYLQIE